MTPEDILLETEAAMEKGVDYMVHEFSSVRTGKASVVLTLPSSPGTVHVKAEGQYALGHPAVVFTETAQ